MFKYKPSAANYRNRLITKDSDLHKIFFPIEAFMAKTIMKYLNVSMIITRDAERQGKRLKNAHRLITVLISNAEQFFPKSQSWLQKNARLCIH